jgi:SAM-dependent methyltransferase
MPVVVNAGCGPLGNKKLPPLFDSWRHLRIDIDPSVQPDIVTSITDLSAIPNGSVDAIYTAHCIEHLYAHEVPRAISEFYRILNDDGFACIIVPDLQSIADYIATDRLHEVIYQSSAGPVTAHDMIFGFGLALSQGHIGMAHRCGFTPTVMAERLKAAPFAEIVLRRRRNLELGALARKTVSAADGNGRSELLAALQL